MKQGRKIRILKLSDDIKDEMMEVYEGNGEVTEAETFLRDRGYLKDNERLYDFRQGFASGCSLVIPKQVRVLCINSLD